MQGNLIKSNRYGKGIHSPFVYRLVTGVIYIPYDFYAFKEIREISGDNLTFEEFKIIFRLVNFFQPEAITMVGDDAGLSKTCLLAKSDIVISQHPDNKELHIKEEEKTGNYNMAILTNACPGIVFEEGVNQPMAFIIRNIKEAGLQQLFEELKKNMHVSVTIALQYLGIAVINDKFQKQNYVINKW